MSMGFGRDSAPVVCGKSGPLFRSVTSQSPFLFPRANHEMSNLVAAVEKGLVRWRGSHTLRGNASNAAFGVIDYVAQPAAMLLAAPFLLHRLGLSQYGVWMLASAVVGSVGTLSMGFGDATVKYVSTYRGRNDAAGVERIIRGTLTINAVLGASLAVLVVKMAPLAAARVFKVEPELLLATTRALQLSGVILFVRSIEGVFISTLRAFEQYAPTVRLSVLSRVVTIVTALILASRSFGVVAIMVGTLAVATCGMLLQAATVQRLLGGFPLVPTVRWDALSEIFNFGCFSWLQALAAVALIHADRLLIGAMLGTASVAYYTICVQATQPIHSLIAASLSFLFPHLSARYEAGDATGVGRVFHVSAWLNLGMAVALSVPVMVLSKPILTFWMGAAFARRAHTLLTILALSYGLLALTVSAHYALLALGRVRFVSFVNVLGGVLSLGVAVLLIPSLGLRGAAIGRLPYGLVLLLNFWHLRSILRAQKPVPPYPKGPVMAQYRGIPLKVIGPRNPDTGVF